MRALVAGTVVEVEVREFTRQDGQRSVTFDAFLAPDNPRYGADRISGPIELAPEKGDHVAYWAMLSAREGRRGPWLSVWCFEKSPEVAAAVAQASGIKAA